MTKRLLALTLLLSVVPAARAHDGPPFPIVLDEIAGPYKVSIWTDPDVGTGTFFVYVGRQDGESTEDVSVRLIVRPASGRLPEAAYACERQVVGRQVRYFGEVDFDSAGVLGRARRDRRAARRGGGRLRGRSDAAGAGAVRPVVLPLPVRASGRAVGLRGDS